MTMRRKIPLREADMASKDTGRPLPFAAWATRYIEPGDRFPERLGPGFGTLPSGEVLSVDREVTGLVRIRYTSGRSKGMECTEKPDCEPLREIVAARRLKERQCLPEEQALFCMGNELDGGPSVVLHAPVRFATDEEIWSATLRRAGMAEFRGLPANIQRTESGLSYFDAISAPGNQTRYTYLLLREVAVVNRATSEVTPSATGRLVGMTQWDRMEVDQRPGLYYVNIMKNGDRGPSAQLLGPFDRHLDALLRTHQVSRHVQDHYTDAVWCTYGTVRLDCDAADAPRGKLNAVFLSAQEQARLPGAEVVPEGEGALEDESMHAPVQGV